MAASKGLRLSASDTKRRAKEIGYDWWWDNFGEFVVLDPAGMKHSYWSRDGVPTVEWEDIVLGWHVKEWMNEEVKAYANQRNGGDAYQA